MTKPLLFEIETPLVSSFVSSARFQQANAQPERRGYLPVFQTTLTDSVSNSRVSRRIIVRIQSRQLV